MARTNVQEGKPAKEVIENFYKEYISFQKADNKTAMALPFSRSFQKLLDENSKICKEKAGTDICGWGADGDVYLDAQEIDPNLTFQNSNFSISEPKPGKVRVIFNIYPSIKDAGTFYNRDILFSLIEEEGKYVVDDIFYSEESARKQIQDENKLFLEN